MFDYPLTQIEKDCEDLHKMGYGKAVEKLRLFYQEQRRLGNPIR